MVICHSTVKIYFASKLYQPRTSKNDEVNMQSAREYLKELINRGNTMLNPKYDDVAIHSAWQLANIGPSQADIADWEQDVKTFNNQYLSDHPAHKLINSAFNINGNWMISSVLNYLRNVYADWKFWDSKEQQTADALQSNATTTALYDVFISHASSDKENYVVKLKQSLDKLKISIFYDTDTLEWGDYWKNKIWEGVSKAEFAIIVISENYFGREWTEKELYELLNRQNKNGQKTILPILHNITIEQLKEKYPAIAEIQSLDSSKYTCDEIALKFAAQLIKRLKA